jgi:histidyl-tRNA synthetase
LQRCRQIGQGEFILQCYGNLLQTPWDEVRKEMVEVKGLAPEAADKIQTFVVMKGEPNKLLQQLLEDPRCIANASTKQALDELKVLFEYLDAYGVIDKVSKFCNNSHDFRSLLI